MDPLIGQMIGPYRVTSRIGDGGMAVVYKGYQESLNRDVAIKVLRSELAQDEQFLERFRREALSVAELSHPNILHVYDAGSMQGLHYIVMAYVDGGSLKDLINQGPVDIDQAVSITAQVADALGHAHKHGLVHRDVKPNNILMTRDGRPLLTDFGIAKAVNESQRLTRTGTSIGTPEYMAPEQIQGQRVDGRTDIYALAIVLYEMLVGWAPFGATTPVATLYRQVNEPPPPLRQANISVPGWLEAVTFRALSKVPQERFQTAEDFAAALRKRQTPEKPAATVLSQGRPTEKPVRESQKKRTSLVPFLIGGIVLLLVALVAGGGYLLLSGEPPASDGTPQVLTITRVITPTPLPNLGTPVLQSPDVGASLAGNVSFQWQWDGAALGANHSFELRIWSEQEEDEGQGVTLPTTDTSLEVDLGSLATTQAHGPGTYLWTVVVVDTSSRSVVGHASEDRALEYSP